MPTIPNFIRWFDEVRNGDVPLVGGKNASLGELYGNLRSEGIAVPNGFALTTEAYYRTLKGAGAWEPLHRLLDGLDVADVQALSSKAAKARRIVYDATDDAALRGEVASAYRRLEREYGEQVSACRPQLRNRRRSAHRQFRWAARQLPQCLGRGGSSMPAETASPRSSPIARSSTGSITASIISRSGFPSAS